MSAMTKRKLKPRVSFVAGLETNADSFRKSNTTTNMAARRTSGTEAPDESKATLPTPAPLHLRHRLLSRNEDRDDIETGGCTAQTVTNSAFAQNPNHRRRKRLLSFVGLGMLLEEEEPEQTTKQYRLTTRQKRSGWKNMANESTEDMMHKAQWFSSELLMTNYLNWTFQTSFFLLLFHFAVGFWGWTLLWGALILGMGELRPECLQVGSLDANNATSHIYFDAYTLSWTTFSATGYGIISPQVSVGINNGHCAGMNVMMAVESFFGFLFSSICAAIIYAKVMRLQSHAKVSFSQPAVIKYGAGVKEALEEGDHEATEEFMSPFPLLEFCIINTDSGKPSSEIINSTVNCVAAILETEASDAVLVSAGVQAGTTNNMKTSRKNAEVRKTLLASSIAERVGAEGGKANFARGLRVTGTARRLANIREDKKLSSGSISSSERSAGSELTDISEQKADQKYVIREGAPLAADARQSVVMDEGSKLAPRRIFSHMHLQTPSHPSFRNVWYLRHELNAESPLLKGKTRKLIAENGGKWPPELNSHEKIRDSIVFHSIIVSFAGTSVSSGSTVYKQQIYEFGDVYVGYCFVKVLHRNKEGTLAIHQGLLNDITAQRGGGGEPIEPGEHSTMFSAAVDAVTVATNTTASKATVTLHKVQDGTGATMRKSGDVAHEMGTATKNTMVGFQARILTAIPGSNDGSGEDDDDESDEERPSAEKKGR